MNWQFTILTIPLFTATIIAIFVLFYAWKRQEMLGARAFLPLMMGIFLWLIGNLLEVGYFDLSRRLFWVNFQYIGIVTVTASWLMFALVYTGRSHLLTRRNLSFLLIEPIIILTLVWTNDFHKLVRRTISLDVTNRYPIWQVELGPAFWLHTIYSYILLLLGAILLAQAYLKSTRIYRRQIGVMLIGAFIPWVSNAFYLVFFGGNGYIDPTPIGFLLSGLLLASGIFGFGLVDISPIARNNVIEKMQDGMFVLDVNNRIVDINPAALRIINCTEDVIGQPGEKVFAPWPNLVKRFRDVTTVNTHISINGNAEQETHYQLSISPLRDKHEHFTGRLVMIHDISQQKQVEKVLKDAKEAAESANRARSAFLANMSHELRTPLTAIIGYSELLQEQAILTGIEKFTGPVEKINLSATHLLDLISDILDMSRIEAGLVKVNPETFSVPALVESVIAAAEPLIEKNNNRLTVSISSDVESMQADQKKLRQILLILLGNAAKFTEDGEIHLSISHNEQNRSTLLFQVADTGIGMTQQQLNRLFQPFKQADESTTRRFGGLGLGLALCHRLCEIMESEITVNSEPGKGSQFTICIPQFAQMEEKPPMAEYDDTSFLAT